MTKRLLLCLFTALIIVLSINTLGVDYTLSQVTLLAIYSIAGLGLFLITGQAGQITLGHGAFIAIGAYTETLLALRGIPFSISFPAAALFAGLGGTLASLPAYRLSGIYFGMSTLAFALITEELLIRWETLTRGSAGLIVPPFQLSQFFPSTTLTLCLFSLGMLFLAFIFCQRCLPTRLGRTWRAIRADETAAAVCAINPASGKISAFILGCALAGIAGALYAHWIGFLSPEQFGLRLSFELLILIYIGGARKISGALWGALIIVTLPQGITLMREQLPFPPDYSTGLEPLLLGFLIILVTLLRCKKKRIGT